MSDKIHTPYRCLFEFVNGLRPCQQLIGHQKSALGNVFKVVVPLDEHVDELKEKVKEKKANTLAYVDADSRGVEMQWPESMGEDRKQLEERLRRIGLFNKQTWELENVANLGLPPDEMLLV
jgi:hypothetical protein